MAFSRTMSPMVAFGGALLLVALGLSAVTPAAAQLGGSPCEEYIPRRVECPAENFVTRVEGNILPEEGAWLAAREQYVNATGAWRDYLLGLQLGLTDAEIAELPPLRMGIALSGGGLRATLNGAGVVAGLTRDDASPRKSAGIMDLMTYFAGISGGSWATGSLFNAQASSVAEWAKTLRVHQNILFPGNNRIQQLSIARESAECGTAKAAAMDAVEADQLGESAEQPLSLADIYGRSLSMALLQNSTDTGPLPGQYTSAGEGTIFSGMAAAGTPVGTGAAALPLIVSGLIDAESPTSWAEALLPWEISPFHSGSYHSAISSFFATSYTGTGASDCVYAEGNVTGQAIVNYDNLGWIMAGSGLYVGQDVDWENMTAVAFLSKFSAVQPNPFSFEVQNPFNSSASLLHITDAGLGSFGSTPVLPMLLPERNVKVVFFVDSSGGSADGYPDGSELFNVGNYAREVMGYAYPRVPQSTEEYASAELSETVTFFGCDDDSAPALVYVPNQFNTYPSNTSTFKFEYSDEELEGMLGNGQAALLNNTNAPEAPLAIGCLIISKASGGGGAPPGNCSALLEKYCWDPSKAPNAPPAPPAAPPPTSAASSMQRAATLAIRLAACALVPLLLAGL